MAAVDLSLPRAVTHTESVQPLVETRAEEDLILRGRALAHLAIDEMIAELDLRASRHQLDRGLRISLPYFDDRRLSLRYWSFTVIPTGRIMFVPAFVVVAVEREVDRVQAQHEFTDSTRTHLLEGLHQLASAFRSGAADNRRSDLPVR
jgi:hypothetical protein